MLGSGQSCEVTAIPTPGGPAQRSGPSSEVRASTEARSLKGTVPGSGCHQARGGDQGSSGLQVLDMISLPVLRTCRSPALIAPSLPLALLVSGAGDALMLAISLCSLN